MTDLEIIEQANALMKERYNAKKKRAENIGYALHCVFVFLCYCISIWIFINAMSPTDPAFAAYVLALLPTAFVVAATLALDIDYWVTLPFKPEYPQYIDTSDFHSTQTLTMLGRNPNRAIAFGKDHFATLDSGIFFNNNEIGNQ